MNLEFLPDKDQKVYLQLTKLSSEEKKLLWYLIQYTSKDGYVLCHTETEKIKLLEQKGLLLRNYFYRGNEISFFVLPSAQQLLKELRKKARVNL